MRQKPEKSPSVINAHPVKKHRYTDKWFAMPAIIWVAITTQLPFVAAIVLSTLKWNLLRPDQGIKFDGINNYAYYLWGRASSEFWPILGQTAMMIVIALVGCTVGGFLLSLLLDHKFPGVNIVRTLILGPFFVMSTTTGVIWKVTILNMTFGWYAKICNFFGWPIVDFLSYYPLELISLLFIWQWMPFFVLVILGGLQSLSEEVLESAHIDGANWWVMTFRIKLPMIFNYMTVAIMLGLIFLIKEFGLILVTTAGGPGKTSYTLAFYIYEILFSTKRVGRAAAVSVITVLIVLFLISTMYKVIDKRNKALN